jgi:hypothetical protein
MGLAGVFVGLALLSADPEGDMRWRQSYVQFFSNITSGNPLAMSTP